MNNSAKAINQYNGFLLEHDFSRYNVNDLESSIDHMMKSMLGNKTIIMCTLTINTEGDDLQDLMEEIPSRVDNMLKELWKLTHNLLKLQPKQTNSLNVPLMTGFWKSLFLPKKLTKFKIILLINTELYFSTYCENPQESLKERLIHSWESINNISISSATEQMCFFPDFAKQFHCNNQGMKMIFPAISQLCCDLYDPVDASISAYQIMPYKPKHFK